MEDENETAPLLGRESRARTEAPAPEEHRPWYQLRRPWHIALLVLLSATLWAFSTATSSAYGAYGDLYIDLDFLRLHDVLTWICRLLVAIPFGILADRARKPVYILASAGQILSVTWMLFIAAMQPMLPPELMLLDALGQLLGGGMLLIHVIHITILTDVLPPGQRLLAFLFRALLQEPFVQLAAFAINSLRHLWSPMPLVLSLVLALLGAALVVFLPETAQGSNPPRAEHTDESWWSKAQSCFHLRFQELGPALAVAKSPYILWVLLALAARPLAAIGYWLTVVAYAWSHHDFGSVGLPDLSLMTVITHCVTLGLLLPALAIVLVHPNGHARFTGFQRDLVLGRISAVFAVAGVLLSFIPAPGLLIVGTIAAGLSAGLYPLGLSLIGYVTPARGYATIYTLVTVSSTLISAVLSPFFYRVVTHVGSLRILIVEVVVVALLYLVILVALFQLKVRSAGPGTAVEAQPEGVRGDGGSVLDNDEGRV